MSENKKELPTKEEVLMNETELLQGLIEAGRYKDEYRKKIVIQRAGKTLFAFTIKPIDDTDLFDCRKRAVKKIPNPMGKNYPAIDGDMDVPAFRSAKIYAATVDEDKAKLWDNRKVQDGLGVISNIDLISKVFMDGEKDYVLEEIDKLSAGVTEEQAELEETAKN